MDRLLEARSARIRRAVTVIVMIAMAIEFYAVPLNAIPYAVDVPAADRWLATRRTPFVVAEVPVGDRTDTAVADQRQSVFMLHSMAHRQKTIHGYSGMLPALHAAVYSELQTFPDDVSLVRLADLDVTYVVVHAGWYPPGEWDAAEARIARYSDWMSLVHTDGMDRVYALQRPDAEVIVRYRERSYLAALAGDDAEPISAFYTNDAIVVRPFGVIVEGREAIDTWAASASGEERPAVTLDPGDPVVRGNEARIEGRFFARGRHGGRQQGKFIQIWRRVAGQWQIAYDVFTNE
jgi:ketosteroid isomerase-like protein